MNGEPNSDRHSANAARIAKFLSRAGVASRRGAERLISEGRVCVNGTVLTTPAVRVSATDAVTVDGRPIAGPQPQRLWRFHKPRGTVTTTRDERGRPTVFDLLPADFPRVMSIGRLDLDSEGLLLFTTDGDIKRRLELPSTGWARKYRVRARGRPGEEALDRLREGLALDGEKLGAMRITHDRTQGANSWFTIVIREGRNREIRRAFGAIGVSVNRLIRVAYGPFRLDDLKPGEIREVPSRQLRSTVPQRAGTASTSSRPQADRNR